MYGAQQIYGPSPQGGFNPSAQQVQGPSPMQVAGATAYYPMQTTGGFDMNSMMNMIMMIMMLSMVMSMMKPLTQSAS